MRRWLFALALNGIIAANGLYAQSNPPCNSGVHVALNETIIPLQNGAITYCISDFGWSDTWLIGSPATYNALNDVLSGDDAFNLRYVTPPAGQGPGTGWLSPSLDEGTLSAQDAPGWPTTPWIVDTHVHATSANTTQSIIHNADGLRITIDAYAPPGAFGVQIALTILNTSTVPINGLRLADYYNFHPNGSSNNLNLLGTTRFLNNCIFTVGQPIDILDGSVCGVFAPAQHAVGYAHQSGAVPPIWQDVTNDIYNGANGPLGPEDTAGALQWNLGNLAPGASVRFAVGKNISPFLPAVLAKAFNPASIPVGGSSTLTFSLNNPNTLPLTGVHFSDTLPANVTVTSTGAITGTCSDGKTISATASSSIVQVTGVTLAGGVTCTFSVTVTSAVGGTYLNTTSVVGSNEGGDGPPATATLIVVPPLAPVISKVFNPASIPVSTTTQLNFTIANPAANTVALLGVGVVDNLPAGLTVSNGTSTVCGTGTLTTTAPNSIVLTGVTIAVNGTCQFGATVTGAVAGSYINTTNPVTSNNGGSGNTATAPLTVVGPPVISKVFNPASIPLSTTTQLNFTISNPASNTVALTGVGFADNLPAGLTVTSSTSSVCGGTLTITAPTTITLVGATIAVNGTCQFGVTVTGAPAGSYTNTTNPVVSTNGGTGNTATAPLMVVAPPVISKVFNPTSILVSTTTQLNFTITNPAANTVALLGVGVVDNLPAGLTVVNGTSSVCGGTLTTTAPTTITLAGATIAVNSTCQFSVTVTGAVTGSYTNTTLPVTSTNGGNGNTATAPVTVTPVLPPVISKVFVPASIAVNGTTQLNFTITNPAANTVALLGVGVVDNLPTGLTVATGTSSVCGGTLTTTAPTTITLAGATISVNGTCQFSVTVTGAVAGPYVNTTLAVTSTNGGNGNTASAPLTVTSGPPPGPPVISKVFVPASIAVNGTTQLNFTITNPVANTVALLGVGVVDNLPVGLTVTNGTSSVCGGTLTTTAPITITLTGATIAVNGTCQFSVTVTGAVTGSYINTTLPVTSTNGGPGNTASAPLIVGVVPPVLSKIFGEVGIGLNSTTTLTFTLLNPNNNVTLHQVTFTDPLPAGLRLANPVGLTGTCDPATITAVPGATTITVANAIFAPSASCTFTVNILGVTPGLKTNTTSAVLSAEAPPGAPAIAILEIGNAYQLTYLANLNRGDSFIDITNTGANGADLSSGTTANITGSICANVYVFSPDEQLISCCSCPVTPNGLVSLSANADLISNTLTPSTPTSVVVKLLASSPVGNSCTNSAAAVTPGSLVNGAAAFSTTLHAVPSGAFAPVEKPFSGSTLSAGELARLTQLCNFILSNGSGFGVCRSCRLGGLGADKQ